MLIIAKETVYVGNKLGFLKATVDVALKKKDLEKEFMEILRRFDINR